MKLLGWLAVTFAFLIVLPSSVSAAGYYVSTSGNDADPGTQAQPWRTIQKAADTAAAGDVVTISPGSYSENVTFSKSGTSGSRITFQGASAPAIVSSNPTNTTCLSSQNSCVLGIVTINASQIVFKNMEVSGAPAKPGIIAGITLSGSNVEISDNFIHNTYKEGIKISSGSNDSLLRNNIAYAVVSGIYFDGTNHLIEGNTITHSVTRGPDRVFFSASSDPDGIRFFGSGTIVRGNTIKDIYLDETPESDGPHSDCFQTWGNASNMTFEKNYCELENTTTYVDPMVKFMMIERLSGYAAVSGIKIINNIFVSKNNVTQWSPIQIGGTTCSTSSPLSDFTIVNNTFVHTGNYLGGFIVLMRCTNTVTIENNAIYNYAAGAHSYIYQDQNNNTGVNISNNSVYNSNGTVPYGGPYPGDNIAETWLKDPKFVNIGSLDLHLSSVSPLINRGVAVAGVTADFDGTGRPQGTAYDIGAYEYSGSMPSTPPTVTPTITPAPTSSGVPTPGSISVCKSGCNYSTIQAAVNAAAPGDIIEVQAGTYSESVAIGKNGTSTAWITLRAKTGDAVWIDGSTLGNVSNINIGNHTYWKIIGLKMRNAAQGSASGADGPADAVTVGAGANNITLQGLTIETPNADGIDLRGANYSIQVLDNTIYEMRKTNPNYNGDGHGIHVLQQAGVAASHDILVKGNYVHDAHGKACLALSDFTALNAAPPYNIVFEYNKVQDCTNGIKINADGIFRYNLIVDTGKYTTGVEKPDSCFQAFTHDAENNVRKAQVYNNTTVGCSNSYNFDMVYNGATPTQTFTVFRNNIAYNPRTYFVRVTGTNITSDGNNLFYKVGGGGSFIGYSPGSTSLVNVDPQLNVDYSLKSTSPAINKGSVVDSSIPYTGSAPDMGAFEYGQAQASPTPTVKSGDGNGDGKVDEADYSIWLSKYGQSVIGPVNGDFNTDGEVDGVDYVIWLNNFGK
jgi:hypothetical protein